MQYRLLIRILICFIVIFVEIPGGSWNHVRSSTEAIKTEELSHYAVDALQMVTSCISPRNLRRLFRFGRCIFNQFSNSDIKDSLIYPKIKQIIRSVLNRTIAEEHTLKFKILNRFISRQFSSRQRYGPGGGGYGGGPRYGYSDYGNNNNNNFGDTYGSVTRPNRYNTYDDNTYP